MARIAEYLRRSSPGEEDKNYSMEDQRRDIARWVSSEKHQLSKSYADPGGKSYTLNRPVFQQMMTDAKAGLFDIVVVGRWDRFSRNQDQQAVAVYQLQQYDVKVMSATQPTPDGPMGTLIRNNYAFAAELELFHIRERTTGGKRARVRSGKLPPLSYPLYGYLFADPDEPHGKSRYIVDPETSEVVRYIFNLVLSGIKLRALGKRLVAEGVLTPSQILARRGQLPKGKPESPVWHPSMLHRILTNSAYIGKLVGWHMTMVSIEKTHPITGEIIVSRTRAERAVDDPDRIVYSADVCPPLVDEAAFNAVQLILERNKEEAARNLHEPEALLLRNGFAICGYCGYNLVAEFSKAQKGYRYICSQACRHPKCPGGRFSWTASQLDEKVWNWVIFQFENPDIIRKKYEQWNAEREEGNSIEHDRLSAMEEMIVLSERRKKNYFASAGDSDEEEDRAEWTVKANNEARRIRELIKERDALRTLLMKHERSHSVVESIIDMGAVALEQLRRADFDDKRRVLYAFDVKAHCWAKRHDPQYEFSWGFERLHEDWVQTQSSFSVPNHLWRFAT